ncbi:uncharacterized protein CLUP02_13795 [Colletotrichum lupini]|uniref:Uncharacterized protein n=1 Tax=Colletotrichum lupini TaxID=145971 RepID=A0A9Q8T360_9PEZI|nr:uncharacterized protein CLUP02_13795 [Colletotrichum lupini]UQC88272.1 hypothetical protein CLUP02_13795 [Colletotrichum lupini]
MRGEYQTESDMDEANSNRPIFSCAKQMAAGIRPALLRALCLCTSYSGLWSPQSGNPRPLILEELPQMDGGVAHRDEDAVFFFDFAFCSNCLI